MIAKWKRSMSHFRTLNKAGLEKQDLHCMYLRGCFIGMYFHSFDDNHRERFVFKEQSFSRLFTLHAHGTSSSSATCVYKP